MGSFCWDGQLDDIRRRTQNFDNLRIGATRCASSIRKEGESGHYELVAYAATAESCASADMASNCPGSFAKSLKGSTAREANLLLTRTGSIFGKELDDHRAEIRVSSRKFSIVSKTIRRKAGSVHDALGTIRGLRQASR